MVLHEQGEGSPADDPSQSQPTPMSIQLMPDLHTNLIGLCLRTNLISPSSYRFEPYLRSAYLHTALKPDAFTSF
eukprot:3706645-Rhodomonas_salina.3